VTGATGAPGVTAATGVTGAPPVTAATGGAAAAPAPGGRRAPAIPEASAPSGGGAGSERGRPFASPSAGSPASPSASPPAAAPAAPHEVAVEALHVDSPYAQGLPNGGLASFDLRALRPMHAPLGAVAGGPGGTLVAGNERVGILQPASAKRPLAGQRLELVGEAPPLRGVVMTTEVLALEAGTGPDVVMLRWLRLASRTAEQLAAAVSALSGHEIDAATMRAEARPGRWIAFEPTTGYVLPCDPPERLGEARPERRATVSRRRGVDVSSRRKGGGE
jgi:hypothetical protein